VIDEPPDEPTPRERSVPPYVVDFLAWIAGLAGLAAGLVFVGRRLLRRVTGRG
jgi:hypothetical protein